MTIKAAAPRHFSIVVFGLTQIVVDLEVLWYLLQRDPPLHRFWHSFLGATVVAAVLAILGKPISQFIKQIWNGIARSCGFVDLTVVVRTSWSSSVIAAVVGAYSHIVLDGLFHRHLEPLIPWSTRNPFVGIISPAMLQTLCVVLGIIGLVWFFGRQARNRGVDMKIGVQER